MRKPTPSTKDNGPTASFLIPTGADANSNALTQAVCITEGSTLQDIFKTNHKNLRQNKLANISLIWITLLINEKLFETVSQSVFKVVLYLLNFFTFNMPISAGLFSHEPSSHMKNMHDSTQTVDTSTFHERCYTLLTRKEKLMWICGTFPSVNRIRPHNHYIMHLF